MVCALMYYIYDTYVPTGQKLKAQARHTAGAARKRPRRAMGAVMWCIKYSSPESMAAKVEWPEGIRHSIARANEDETHAQAERTVFFFFA